MASKEAIFRKFVATTVQGYAKLARMSLSVAVLNLASWKYSVSGDVSRRYFHPKNIVLVEF
jgi:hypothetical protein